MARQQTSRYAVLGMLTHGPRSGYDIKREIGASVRHFWSESYGQVYPVLRELVAEGLATLEIEFTDGRPPRKVYTITEAGLAEFQQWLAQPVVPQPSRNELLLKLFFGRHIPADALVNVVREVRDRWAADVAEWVDIADHVRADTTLSALDARDRLFTLEYGRMIGEATIQWADKVIAALQAPATPDQEQEPDVAPRPMPPIR